MTTFFDQPLSIAPFSLTTDDKKNFTLDDLKGRWSFLFFGYLNCPDICPNTMARLNSVYRMLADEKVLDDAAFIFITVDPERDGVREMAEYVGYFNENFIGLTGSRVDMDALMNDMEISYRINKTSDQEYVVDHTSAVLLINPAGHQAARFSKQQTAGELSADFKKIRKAYE